MSFKTSPLFNQLLLLVAAIAWGFAFVAQRSAMDDLGPFLFNGLRFLAGGLTLLLIFRSRVTRLYVSASSNLKDHMICAAKLAIFLFMGASCQQLAMISSEAGRAGFITSLYLIFIPLILLVVYRQKTNPALLFAVLLAVLGMFLLTDPSLNGVGLYSDALLVLCAVFFAAHMIAVGRLVVGRDAIVLAAGQFILVGLISLLVAVIAEQISLAAIEAAAIPLMYAAFISCAIGYTLQVIGQAHVETVPATLILSLEAVFSLVGGVCILGETLGSREMAGCLLVLFATFLAQISPGQLVDYLLKPLKRNTLSKST